MSVQRAGFWRRTAATTIDVVLMLVVLLLIQSLAAYLDDRHLVGRPMRFAFALLGYVVPLLYFALEMAMAATPGKLMTGLRITNLDGTEPPLARLVSRWTAKWSYLLIGLLGFVLAQTVLIWLGNLMGYVVLIGCLAAAGDAKLAWHDSWAQTAVCRRVQRRSPSAGMDGVATRVPAHP